MRKYYCNKDSGLMLNGVMYKNGDEIPGSCDYSKLISWGWVKVVGSDSPKVIRNDPTRGESNGKKAAKDKIGGQRRKKNSPRTKRG